MKRLKWTKRDISALKKAYKVYPYKIPEWLIGRHGQAGCHTKANRLKFAKGIRNPGIDLRKLKKVEKAYIAGFIDGEGSILWNEDKPKTNPAIFIANTDRGVLEWVKKRFIKGGLSIHKRKYRNPKYKPLYQFYIHGIKNVYDILRAIIPYLVIKKAQAQKVVKFLKRKYDL
jgi:hypothetical protein